MEITQWKCFIDSVKGSDMPMMPMVAFIWILFEVVNRWQYGLDFSDSFHIDLL